MDAGELDRTIEVLEAAMGSVADTVRHAPHSTIEPQRRTASAGRRALELLRQIDGGQDPGGAARLELAETLGSGGMGIVRLGEQVAMGRKVAVKTLRPEHTSDGAILKVLQEAWVTGYLEHPNVVPVYDIGLGDDGRPVIVLKRIEGVLWQDVMLDEVELKRRFGADDALEWNLRILITVCNAVHFAHSRGIVHRDLKPENIMIGEFGEVYVLDWGIAVSLEDDDSGRLPLAKHATEMAGTPCYMAPEQMGGETSRIGPSTDVYLLGGILHEFATGSVPHPGHDFRTIVASIIGPPPEMSAAPPELARIGRRAMDNDPDARFETAEQIRLALEGYLEHRGSRRLAQRAQARLDELLLAMDAEDAGSPEVRQRLHNLFAECRFGFREALRGWQMNELARLGIERATVAMVEHELCQGAPRSASNVLAGLDEPNVELQRRVDDALAAAEAENAKLKKLSRDHDVKAGQRTRTFFMAILGSLWTIAPITAARLDVGLWGHTESIVLPFVLMAIVLAFGWWARDTMTKTLLNRRFFGTILVTLGAQSLLTMGAAVLGIDPAQTQVFHFLLWSTVAAMASLTLDKRLWPTSVSYLAGFFAASFYPEHRYYLMGATNFFLMANGIIVWKPPKNQLFRRTDEEIAEAEAD